MKNIGYKCCGSCNGEKGCNSYESKVQSSYQNQIYNTKVDNNYGGKY